MRNDGAIEILFSILIRIVAGYILIITLYLLNVLVGLTEIRGIVDALFYSSLAIVPAGIVSGFLSYLRNPYLRLATEPLVTTIILMSVAYFGAMTVADRTQEIQVGIIIEGMIFSGIVFGILLLMNLYYAVRYFMQKRRKV